MSVEPIVSKEALASDADAAALRYVETGVEQMNPWPAETAAHAEWRAAFQRYVLLHSSEESSA